MSCDVMCRCNACVNSKITKEDVVNEPSHYKVFPKQEAISIIRNVLTTEEMKGYLKGNILKYRLRAGNKGSLEEDIAKADKYREWLGDLY